VLHAARAARLTPDAHRIGADDLHFELDKEIEEATRAQPHPINAVTGAACWPLCLWLLLLLRR